MFLVVVVAQLAEGLLLTQEVHNSSPVIGKIYTRDMCLYFSIESVVTGGDLSSRDHGIEYRHLILDGHFSHLFIVKIELCFEKT